MVPKPPRPRGDLRYSKDALPLDALVDRLSQRGLAITDRARATRYLRHIGYFRLSPYTIPFQTGGPDHFFRDGTTFDDVLDLYVFDRMLRLLVLDALERIEVAVRAALTDHMSTTYDDPHWYTDPAHFKNRAGFAKLLSIVRQTCEIRLSGEPEQSTDSLVHRSALEHYLTTYGEPELPPSWLIVETLTIGQVRKAIANLQRGPDRAAIAQSIGLKEPILTSWMRTYVRVRNVCAHRGRLWNVGLGVYPAIPKSSEISWPRGDAAVSKRSGKRLYPVLASLQSVLDTVSPRSSWAHRLQQLLAERPQWNLVGMGFPDHWTRDEFWARHL